MVANNKAPDEFNTVWILDENWSGDKNQWTQGSVTVQPSQVADDYEYKVVVQANKGNNNQSYIAFDEVLFVNEKGNCDIQPPGAKPTEAPPTTVAPTTTSTPPPTEPPGRKLSTILFRIEFSTVFLCSFQPSLCVTLKQTCANGKLNQATMSP